MSFMVFAFSFTNETMRSNSPLRTGRRHARSAIGEDLLGLATVGLRPISRTWRWGGHDSK